MADPAKHRLGEQLAAMRKDAGCTQTELGQAVGLGKSRVSEIERGQWAGAGGPDLVRSMIDACAARLPAGEGTALRRAHLLGLLEVVEAARNFDLPDPASLAPAPNQLRRDVPTFTGRQEEIDRVLRVVHRSTRHQAIAVHAVDGRPGVGKSAFATKVAHLLRPRFPDGQLFLDLQAHSGVMSPLSPAEALGTLLAAIGVPPRSIPDSLDERSALWRGAWSDRRALLVLDDAHDEQQVLPLLPNSPRSLVLVTSRRRLVGLDVTTVSLDVLALDEARLMLRRVSEREVPDEPAGQLVELCGRLPLAIAVVGRQLRNRPALTVDRQIRRLSETMGRLSVLRAGDLAVAAAIELSYRELPAAVRDFFRTLALHPGPDLDPYAAAALTGTAVRVSAGRLEELFTANLVDEFVYERFQLHDLVAEYLRDRCAELPEHVAWSARERVTRFFTAAAVSAGRWLRRGAAPGSAPVDCAGAEGPAGAEGGAGRDDGAELPELADRPSALAWFAAERANLLAVLRLLDDPAVAPGRRARVVELSTAMARHLQLTGPWDVAAEVFGRAAETARASGTPAALARALLDLGTAHRNLGDYATAARRLSEAAEACDASDQAGIAPQVMIERATVHWLQGEYAPAWALLQSALDAARESGDAGMQAEALLELGSLHYMCDEYRAALAVLGEALSRYDRLGDDEGRALALKNLGNTWYFLDDYAQARRALEQARRLAHDLGMVQLEAQALTKLGSVARLTGRYDEAAVLLEQAGTLARRLMDRSLEAEILIDTGTTLHRLGRDDDADRAFGRCLELYTALDGEDVGHACALTELAVVRVEQSDLDAGQRLLEEAQERVLAVGDQLLTAALRNGQGRLLLACGDPAAAATAHQEALGLARRLHSPLEEGLALLGLARAELPGPGRVGHARQAREVLTRIGAAEAGEAADLAD